MQEHIAKLSHEIEAMIGEDGVASFLEATGVALSRISVICKDNPTHSALALAAANTCWALMAAMDGEKVQYEGAL